jgi:hypothetical protein
MERGWEAIKPLKTTEKTPFLRRLQVTAGIRREVEEAGTVKIDFRRSGCLFVFARGGEASWQTAAGSK